MHSLERRSHADAQDIETGASTGCADYGGLSTSTTTARLPPDVSSQPIGGFGTNAGARGGGGITTAHILLAAHGGGGDARAAGNSSTSSPLSTETVRGSSHGNLGVGQYEGAAAGGPTQGLVAPDDDEGLLSGVVLPWPGANFSRASIGQVGDGIPVRSLWAPEYEHYWRGNAAAGLRCSMSSVVEDIEEGAEVEGLSILGVALRPMMPLSPRAHQQHHGSLGLHTAAPAATAGSGGAMHVGHSEQGSSDTDTIPTAIDAAAASQIPVHSPASTAASSAAASVSSAAAAAAAAADAASTAQALELAEGPLPVWVPTVDGSGTAEEHARLRPPLSRAGSRLGSRALYGAPLTAEASAGLLRTITSGKFTEWAYGTSLSDSSVEIPIPEPGSQPQDEGATGDAQGATASGSSVALTADQRLHQ
jgi:hypothetical protein